MPDPAAATRSTSAPGFGRVTTFPVSPGRSLPTNERTTGELDTGRTVRSPRTCTGLALRRVSLTKIRGSWRASDVW